MTDLPDKSIPSSMHGEEELRLFRIGLELLPQPHQVRIHGARRRVVVVSPNVFQQTIAAERFAGMADEILQQLEFLGRNVNGLAMT